ncbi:MAG: hypothetical protein AB7O49_04255 [Sphingomonadales bacterium]
MANYVVSYDLNGKNPTHAEMDAHIKRAGWAYGRILETVWYIGTTATTKQVYEHINAILSTNDRVIVVKATDAWFRNLLVSDDSLQKAWTGNA